MYKGYSDRLRNLKKENKIINNQNVLCIKCKNINFIKEKVTILCYFCNNPIQIK